MGNSSTDDIAATTRRSVLRDALSSVTDESLVRADGLDHTQTNVGIGGIQDTQVVPDFRPQLPQGFQGEAAGPELPQPTMSASSDTPALPYMPYESSGADPGGAGAAFTPPEVWLVSGGLLLLAALVLYPALKFAGPLVPDLFAGNRFVRALSALFLEFAVILVACGAALLGLAWGLIRGSRVAQVLTCVLAAIVSIGEIISAQDHEPGTPSVPVGVAVASFVVTVLIIGLLVGSARVRAFYERDARPAGVVMAATTGLYLGGVAVLDGLLLMLAGTISRQLVGYGVAFAVTGLILIVANALLRRRSAGARATILVGYAAYVGVVLVFANKYDELSGSGTLVPIGLVLAATVGLLVPSRSQEYFSSNGPGWASPTTRAPGLVATLSLILVAVLGATAVGLSSRDSDPQAAGYTPDYSSVTDNAAPVSTSSDLSQTDAQGAATATMEALEGSGSSNVCDSGDLPDIDVYDYRIRDVSPQTAGTFSVSASVGLNDGTYETVTFLVTEDGSGSPCAEADSFDTQVYSPDDLGNGAQPSVPSAGPADEPTDVPSVPSSGDPVPTDAPLPGTPSGSVIPYDSDTTPTSADELVEYRTGGLTGDQTSAVSTVIGFMTYINQQDFDSAWNLSTNRVHGATATAAFRHGYLTSRFYQVEFGQPSELAGDLIVVPGRFVSRQDPTAQGDPDGVTSCSYWPQYMFTVVKEGARWVVDTSGSAAGRSELDPLKRQGTDGRYLNPAIQREDCS